MYLGAQEIVNVYLEYISLKLYLIQATEQPAS